MLVQQRTQVNDGIGGSIEKWITYKEVEGYIDMLSGTDVNTNQPSITEESTHILILLPFIKGISDSMRVIDSNRVYYITYSDNPMDLNHHNEIYLKYGGGINEA